MDTKNTYILYVMTHDITGLKYLGYTTQDLKYYNGSGRYWRKHLQKHGTHITKEILLETTDYNKLVEMGVYYSELWDVVKSVGDNRKKLWANEKPECGIGGGMTDEIKSKVRATKLKNGTTENNPVIIAKILDTKKKNGTKGGLCTIEAYQKWRDTLLTNNGTLDRNTPESVAKANATRISRGRSFADQSIKDKIRDSKLKNNTMNPNNPESNELRRQTKHNTFMSKHGLIIPTVIILYKQHMTAYSISKKINYCYTTIRTIIDKYNKGYIND